MSEVFASDDARRVRAMRSRRRRCLNGGPFKSVLVESCSDSTYRAVDVDADSTHASDRPARNRSRRRLGSYRLLEKIGEGGMGEVFLALDTKLQRRVALKFLHPDTRDDHAARAGLLREARAAAALDHPFVCQIHEIGDVDDEHFIAMEYVGGRTLKQALARDRPALAEVLRWAVALAEALEAAHEQGILHRDLKPANIMLTPKGHVKVLDFGLAKRFARPAAEPSSRSTDRCGEQGDQDEEGLVGTPAYMSPEQVRQEPPDTRSDIFSFGIVLYEMISGRHPFRRRTLAGTMAAIEHDAAPPLADCAPDVPALLPRIVQRMLAKQPGARYASAGEVRRDLQEALAAARQRRGSSGAPSGSWRRRLLLGLAAAVALIGFDAVGWGQRRPAAAQGSVGSVAVLPLVDLSGADEYFADGMTEALITNLSRIAALTTISRSSVMRYKDVEKPLPEIARDLGVDALVEGSVMRVDGRVRIAVRLVEAESSGNLWAREYQRDFRDVLALQSEVAQAIAGEIRVAVTPDERARLNRTARIDPAAYESFLKGRFFWNRRTEPDLLKSIEHFEQALRIDPLYAEAHAGLADAYVIMASYRYLPADEVLPRAREAATRALRLDDSIAEAHCALAKTRLLDEWDWHGAGRGFERAIELNPSYATAHHWRALWLAWRGRSEEAAAAIKRGREIDPTSLIINTNAGWLAYFDRRYDEAIARLESTLEMDADFPPALYKIGHAYRQRGRYAEATAAFERLSELIGWPSSGLAHTLAQSGERAAALRTLQRTMDEGHATACQVAGVHVALHEHELALDWLERAVDEKDPYLQYLLVEPAFDALRPLPRFQAILDRVGLSGSRFPPSPS